MTAQPKSEVRAETTNWSVVAVYEDTETREGATSFCDQLVHRFWPHCGLDVGWWSLGHLEATDSGAEAAGKAIEADMILISLRAEGETPASLRTWVESWLARRGDREGVVVGLGEPSPSSGAAMPDKYAYLRNIAHRAGMDYLTGLPQNLSRSIPDSFESYIQRADLVTSVLDEILHKLPPRHFLP